jgi:hypothetical protein
VDGWSPEEAAALAEEAALVLEEGGVGSCDDAIRDEKAVVIDEEAGRTCIRGSISIPSTSSSLSSSPSSCLLLLARILSFATLS